MKKLYELSNGFFDNIIPKSNELAIKEGDFVCFKTAVETFLHTGLKEDAFTVYFCFSEIFQLFGEGYKNTKKLLEMLSDHEYHSGELLAKHRDHYSHSAYVFAIGLAVFTHDETYRNKYLKFYGCSKGEGYIHFLKYWGMTSLFHDIGYPYQLAHEQIKTYGQELWGENDAVLYVSYGNLEKFIALTSEQSEKIRKDLSVEKEFQNINEILAYGLKMREGYDSSVIAELLSLRIIKQPRFMDHGYFSSLLLLKQLITLPNGKLTAETLDVLTAILLHNNLNKYDIKDSHPIEQNEHPLAYLLILCDELQNWDRLAYGKISKRDPIAWNVLFDISDNQIKAEYIFDSDTVIGADGKTRLNKSLEEIQNGKFVASILGGTVGQNQYNGFIKTSLRLDVKAIQKAKKRKSSLFASENSFINLYDFATAIHASYLDLVKYNKDTLNEEFSKLALEFKVSNIQQAKSYGAKLELINCFYSSKDLDYPVVEDFEDNSYGNYGSDNFGFLCREEHCRWVKEKIALGWQYGEKGKGFKSVEERNAKKLHNCMVPYELLSEEDKEKDALMIRNIIPMLQKYGNGIRIYSFRNGRKPDLVVAATGHRYFNENRDNLKKQIKKELLKYSESYRVIVRTSYAYGADQLIAECANELGITTKATLPMPYDEFLKYVWQDAVQHGIEYTAADDMKLRLLLAQTVVCKCIKGTKDNPFEAAAKYNIGGCDRLIALWDGKELERFDKSGKPINRGGTYDCIFMAKEKGMRDGLDICVVRCHR